MEFQIVPQRSPPIQCTGVLNEVSGKSWIARKHGVLRFLTEANRLNERSTSVIDHPDCHPKSFLCPCFKNPCVSQIIYVLTLN